MEIIFTVTESTLVAELLGELDHHAAEGTREKIDKAMDNYKVSGLIMDFKKVSFMDSSGIGMILGRYRKLGEKGFKIAISGCSPSVRNILNMAGVFSIIDYYQDREEAVREMNRKEVS